MHDLKEIRRHLIEWTREQIDMGPECVDTQEMGEVIDMIKDINEAMYYHKVVEAMEEGEEHGMTEMPEMPWWMPVSAGYDKWRHPTTGRYAKTGHGRKYGYMGPTPKPYMDEMVDDMDMMFEPMPHPKTYYDYMDERKYYTETGDKVHKEAADHHAMAHMEETTATIRDIWKDADPELRKKMKADITKLVGDMQA